MSDVNVSGFPAESTATPSTTPAAASPAATAPPATTAAPAAPAVAATSTPAPTSTPGEGWVPSYRLREAREAAQREWTEKLSTREAELRAESDRYKSQIQALVGVQPPQNPEADAVKSQFAKLYPGLAKMEERAAQLEDLLARSGDLQSQNEHYWESYGRQTMDRLITHAQESLGTSLTEEGKRQLHSSFVGFISQSPELQHRYANDPTVVEDFWKAFTASFIDPIRRATSATVVGRAGQIAGLPQDSPSGAPRVGLAPKPADLDERAALGWAQYNAPKG